MQRRENCDGLSLPLIESRVLLLLASDWNPSSFLVSSRSGQWSGSLGDESLETISLLALSTLWRQKKCSNYY